MQTRFTFVVPFVAVAALAAQSGPRLFEGPPVYVPSTAPPGQTEEMELLGDVDNDGDVDVIAFTRSAGYGVSFRPLRNDGFGNLTAGAPVAIPASNSATRVCTGDVDGDGFLDVITNGIQAGASGLFVFRNLGGSTWAAPVFVALPGTGFVLATGNANGDAIADVFVMHGGPTTGALWLLGDPALTFPLGPTVSFGGPSIGRGAVLDLDGDGITDFAGIADTGVIDTAVLYRTTATGLVPYGSFPIGSSNVLIAADLDGDADADLLAVGQQSSQQYRVLRNDGLAGFTPLAVQSVSGSMAYEVRAVDWDGDGDCDLLARDSGVGPTGPVGYGVTLIENVNGQFVFRRRDTFAENTNTFGAGTADIDGDGRQDYVDPHFLVFGTGAFVLPPATAFESAIDWDGDGDLDSVGTELRVNDGRGVLTLLPAFRPTPPAGHLYTDIGAIGDFDGDGLPEMLVQLVFPNPYPGFVEMRRLEANGDGRLVDVGSAGSAQIAGFANDVDDDGDVDVLGSQGLWRNNGAGTFTLVPFAIAGFTASAAADVDGDGDLDLIGALNFQMAVAYRTAPGTFTVTLLTAPGVTFAGISPRLADLDDDGDLDIATAGTSYFIFMPTVIYRNNGGTFAPGTPLAIGGQVLPGDFDGDGLTDLCVQDQSVLYVLRRLGPGLVYAPPQTYAWSAARYAVDLDQDGDVDLIGAATLWNTRFSGASAGQRRQYGIGGAGSGGRRPLLSMLGPLRSGLSTAARVVAAPGGSIGALFISGVEANVPNALPGVTSYVGASFAPIVGVFGGAPGQPGAGAVDMPFAIPLGANGARLFLQFVLLDPVMPIGLGYSNGCELFVGL